MIGLRPGATGHFFGTLGRTLDAHWGRPRAVLAVSAHTALPPARQRTGVDAALLAAPTHAAVYDFGGFDPALSRLRYDAAGEPSLADEVVTRLADRGLRALALRSGGLDHGIWTALRYLYPDADVPVLPLAWPIDGSADELHRMGEALMPLTREGVLVMATGSITHNLQLVFSNRAVGHGLPDDDTPEVEASRAFRHWWAEQAQGGHRSRLLAWHREAPHAAHMHPSTEHLMPWFLAAGAGADASAAVRLHEGVTFGCLGMDAYAFGPSASALSEALAAHGPGSTP